MHLFVVPSQDHAYVVCELGPRDNVAMHVGARERKTSKLPHLAVVYVCGSPSSSLHLSLYVTTAGALPVRVALFFTLVIHLIYILASARLADSACRDISHNQQGQSLWRRVRIGNVIPIGSCEPHGNRRYPTVGSGPILKASGIRIPDEHAIRLVLMFAQRNTE